MANAVNEALIKDVIQDVLGRLGGDSSIQDIKSDNGSCGCSGKGSRKNGHNVQHVNNVNN